MINITDKKNCSGCTACYNICPKNCIKMVQDEEGFDYPRVETASCVSCGLCEKVCPEINKYSKVSAYNIPSCLAAWNKNKAVRENSSSGGVFTSIAEWIIGNGGVVFGAGYDKDHKVIHKAVYKLENLSELRGSKYLQSDINNTYKSAKEFLDKGKSVLFTGTPCQIAGLYNFLQSDYEDVYTCDIVCHGVPSPIVFQKYKQNLEKSYNSKVKRISFRNKKNGWKNYNVAIQFENDIKYNMPSGVDPYMKGFLRNYFLRPSCYKCSYAKIPRVSDITLGDFWGIANKYPELDDDKGTSLLLINTAKGKIMLKGCEKSIYQQECELAHAIKGNPSLISSVKVPKQRQNFFQDLKKKDFDFIIKRYMSPPGFTQRKILFVKRALRLIKKTILK